MNILKTIGGYAFVTLLIILFLAVLLSLNHLIEYGDHPLLGLLGLIALLTIVARLTKRS